MSYNKKIVAALLIIAFGLTLIPFITAQAAGLDVSVSLVGEGIIDVHMDIHNDSEYPMTNISIEFDGSVYNLPQPVAAGGSQPLNISGFYVGTDYSRKVNVVMSWTENEIRQSITQPITLSDYIVVDTPEPTIYTAEEMVNFDCSVNNPRAEKGQEVTITYAVTNNSPNEIRDIVIIDSAVSESPIVSGKSIAAGRSAYFKHVLTMGDENITTNPQISFSYEGNMNTLSGTPITIECVTIDMDVSVVKNDPNSKGTEFIIKLANNGNKPISNIQIFETKSNKQLCQAFDLESGEAKDMPFNFTPKNKQTLQFKVTGKLATGKAYEYESKSYTIWEYIDPTTVGLEFEVVAVEPLTEEGYAALDITVKNIGTEIMSDISVTETKMGKVAGFSDLMGGGEETQSILPYVGEARDLTFTLTGYAHTGEPYEYKLTLSAQAISLGSNSDTVTGFRGDQWDIGGAVSRVFQKILTVLSILALITGAGLITLAIFERQKSITTENK